MCAFVTASYAATATVTKTSTITVTSTVTPTITATITVTSTPTISGKGYNVMVPSQITPVTAPILSFNYYPNGWTFASGLLVLDVPSAYPVPQLTPGVGGYITITASNGVLGSVTIATRKISINVTSLKPYNSWITLKYGNVTPVETPLAAGAYTWQYSSAPSSQVAGNVTPVVPVMVGYVATAIPSATVSPTATQTATLTGAQMTKTATYTAYTSTATLTPTATNTPTPNPNRPLFISDSVTLSSGATYLKSFEVIAKVGGAGVIHLCNASTNTAAAMLATDFTWTFSPVSLTFPANSITFGGKGLYFSKGITAYSDLSYTSATNGTITAHCGY